jgi:tRNA uridine 5-carbamoylmethylation protein Kti12
MARLNKIIIVCGRRGSGKTTFAKKLISCSPLKTLVLDTFDHKDYRNLTPIQPEQLARWKSGNVRLFTGDPVENCQIIFNNVHNSLVVFEDARRYIEPTIQKPIRQGIVEHRNKNNDLVFMFHNLKDVPPYLCTMFNSLVLFKTNDNMDVMQHKYSNWGEIKEAHTRIMKHKVEWYNETINLQ